MVRRNINEPNAPGTSRRVSYDKQNKGGTLSLFCSCGKSPTGPSPSFQNDITNLVEIRLPKKFSALYLQPRRIFHRKSNFNEITASHNPNY
jgi:hypothetical protein